MELTAEPWSKLIDDWFGPALNDPAEIDGRSAWWFGQDQKRDDRLRERYGELVMHCEEGRHRDWLGAAEGRLALIIALDQLPRNLYRGTPRAFASDFCTAAWSLAAITAGIDRQLLAIQRVFLYMPLQHAEDLAAQDTSVLMFRQLAEDCPDWPCFEESFLPYAELHRDIIARFGRFPHRNAVLGRVSTEEETAYLAADAPDFGQ